MACNNPASVWKCCRFVEKGVSMTDFLPYEVVFGGFLLNSSSFFCFLCMDAHRWGRPSPSSSSSLYSHAQSSDWPTFLASKSIALLLVDVGPGILSLRLVLSLHGKSQLILPLEVCVVEGFLLLKACICCLFSCVVLFSAFLMPCNFHPVFFFLFFRSAWMKHRWLRTQMRRYLYFVFASLKF